MGRKKTAGLRDFMHALPRRKSSGFWDSEYLNSATFNNLLTQITELALNAIEYRNLPDTVDPRWIERQLFFRGYGLYFNDELLGDLFLECTLGGKFDVYDIPITRRAFAANGYHKTCTKADSVVVFNNYTHTPGILTAEMFAYRLCNVLRTADVNVNAQKMPFIVRTSDTQRLTYQNMVKSIAGNELYVYVDKDSMDLEGLTVTPTPAPFVADKLRTYYHDLWNECLTFYGYENSNQNKKERSVEAEVTSEYGWIEGQRNIMLNSRREAFDKINKMFGTDIEVGFSSQLPSLLNKNNPFMSDFLSNFEIGGNGMGGDDNE